MTTRKAQGATLDGAVLYMDMMFRPASQGYAYVGASRVKHHSQLFCYGTVQRSDWIPVGEPMLGWQLTRSDESNFARGHSSDDTSGSDYDPLEAVMNSYERASLQQSMSDSEVSDGDNDAYSKLTAPPMLEEDSGTDISDFDVEALRPMSNDAESLETAVTSLLCEDSQAV